MNVSPQIVRSALLAIGLLAVNQASALVIGIPVNNGNPVGPIGPLGDIGFYIPLSDGASGDYGDGNIGLDSDWCYYSGAGTCDDGYLDMTIRFGPVYAGPAQVFLGFYDLDLIGASDTGTFFETLYANGEYVDEAWDPNVVFANTSFQAVAFWDVLVPSGPYFDFDIRFTSLIDGGQHGWYRNTEEQLIATLIQEPPQSINVPEPGTLSLLTAGLLGMGVIGRRRRRQIPD